MDFSDTKKWFRHNKHFCCMTPGSSWVFYVTSSQLTSQESNSDLSKREKKDITDNTQKPTLMSSCCITWVTGRFPGIQFWSRKADNKQYRKKNTYLLWIKAGMISDAHEVNITAESWRSFPNCTLTRYSASKYSPRQFCTYCKWRIQ